MTTTSKVSSTPAGGFDVDFLSAQRQLLEEEQARLEGAVASLAADLAALHDPTGIVEADFSEEGGEGSAISSEVERADALRATLNGRLFEVGRALRRVDTGRYGFCVTCHQPIAEARLEALPDAEECVSCKSGSLMLRRRHRSGSGEMSRPFPTA